MSDLASFTSSLGINFSSSDFAASTDEMYGDQPSLNDPSSSGTEEMTSLQSLEDEELISVDEQTELEEEKTESDGSMVGLI